ncbi:MAG: DUF4203 domain-containing protein [Lachnospiraceae bacterium]|nr:DUF4203 domain-containing protein [Lachnospiraceae bacterium]
MEMGYLDRYMEAVASLAPVITSYGYAGIIAAALIALVFAFFGYKLLRLFLVLMGLGLGISLGGSAAIALNLEDKLIVIISLVIGVLFAFLAGVIYKAGLFAVFAAAGFYLGTNYLSLFYSGAYARWIVIGFALIMGLLSAWLGKVLVIILSSLAGGLALVQIIFQFVLTQFLELNSSQAASIIMVAIGGILAVVAIRYQFTSNEGE